MAKEFEAYSTTASNYDKTRATIGEDLILGVLLSIGRPLHKLRLLDAGCGTGNYDEFLANHVGKIFCFDLEIAMLKRARKKLNGNQNTHFLVANAVDLPIKHASLDAVMMNQVAHHLEDPGNEEQYLQLEKFITCAFDVLRPGGVLILNTSSRTQVTDGYWWATLIPDAVAKVRRRYPPLSVIKKLMLDAGFYRMRKYVPLDAVLQAQAYFDPEGPLKKIWRNGDSTWSLASKGELRKAMDKVKALISSRKIDEYFQEREQLRHVVGQTTFMIVSKPKGQS